VKVKRGDWVSNCGRIGLVRRVARDGTWADVDWGTHRKRMPVSALKVETTIRVGPWEVTDLTRQAELEAMERG
jgi:hypothetical protein